MRLSTVRAERRGIVLVNSVYQVIGKAALAGEELAVTGRVDAPQIQEPYPEHSLRIALHNLSHVAAHHHSWRRAPLHRQLSSDSATETGGERSFGQGGGDGLPLAFRSEAGGAGPARLPRRKPELTILTFTPP